VSSLPAAVSSRLPTLWPASTRARRAALIGAALVLLAVLAAAGLMTTGRPSTGSASAPALAAAHGRALALARERIAAAATSPARPATARVVARVADASQAGDLFSKHSWYVPPPPPPVVAPPPPPPPSAPPFPYTAMGSFAPEGAAPVYFLARADRVIDVRVGDRIDGVYQFESADAGQLVFNYLPLNIRQPVPLGVAP
jgi:hypothetical protein